MGLVTSETIFHGKARLEPRDCKIANKNAPFLKLSLGQPSSSLNREANPPCALVQWGGPTVSAGVVQDAETADKALGFLARSLPEEVLKSALSAGKTAGSTKPEQPPAQPGIN